MHIEWVFLEFKLMMYVPFFERLPFVRVKLKGIFGMAHGDFFFCKGLAFMPRMPLLPASLAFLFALALALALLSSLLWWLYNIT